MSDDLLIHTERKNKTIICTVLFADIIKFSERGVSDQTIIKNHFNDVVSKALSHISERERLILDTGDGVAVCLFGDPEEGLFLGLTLCEEFKQAKTVIPDYAVRLGLNLGPIKLVTDLNGRFNAIGDGINVAQRVMSFAEPGQILCARSFFEVVSRLADDFQRMFEYSGVRHDKHVREHDIYEVRAPGSAVVSSYEVPQDLVPKKEVTISAENQKAIATLLAKFEGPLATVLVKKACRTCETYNEVIESIASQMSYESEASEFRTQALEVLENSQNKT